MAETTTTIPLEGQIADLAANVDITSMAMQIARQKEISPNIVTMNWDELMQMFQEPEELALIETLRYAKPEQLGRQPRVDTEEPESGPVSLITFKQPYMGANGKNYDPLPKVLPKHVYEAYQKMQSEYLSFLKKHNKNRPGLLVLSGYRSPAYQAGLLLSAFATQGVKSTLNSIALPSESEHSSLQFTAIDFTAIGDDKGSLVGKETKGWQIFEDFLEFGWILKNGAKFGFALTYFPDPKDPASGLTSIGFLYEPWHWRYLGPEKAKAFTEGQNADGVNVYNLVQRRKLALTS